MWTRYSLSLVAFLAFGVRGGHPEGKGPPHLKDFHTFREVKVHLIDPLKSDEDKIVEATEIGDGHHLENLHLLVTESEEAKVLFDIDLLLNRELLPQNYFQKYHRKVSRKKLSVLGIYLTNDLLYGRLFSTILHFCSSLNFTKGRD